MADIKLKDCTKKTIKVFDKASVVFEKTKDSIVKIKNNSNNLYSEESNINEYGSREINKTINNTTNSLNKYGKKSIIKTKDNLHSARDKIKIFKHKVTDRNKKIKDINKKFKRNKKIAKKTVKTTVKVTKRSIQLTKATVKTTIKIVTTTIKVILGLLKGLIALLVAGGWIAVLIIIIICIIGFLCSSIYGIFFSNEVKENNMTVSSVISELNNEVLDKIEEIKDNNSYDEVEIISNRADWKEIVAIYTVMVYNDDTYDEVLTMNEDKSKKLKKVFWDMTSIENEIKDEESKKTLYIKILGNTKDNIINQYNFNSSQKEQLNELLNDEYSTLWNYIIYGNSNTNSDLVQIALLQVGNVGGEPYWRWYGFNSRVEWCAVFISWVANEAGYIESNIIPKFAACIDGVNWFKLHNCWKDKGYIPKAGDIVFFDWEQDGQVDHVGIVEKVENDKLYTIEGNSIDDMCRQLEYNVNSKFVFGYGIT